MKTFTIEHKNQARKWVKERLKRHPGFWIIEQEAVSAHCWQGEISIRMRNVSDNWTGWFPVDDIEMIENKS